MARSRGVMNAQLVACVRGEPAISPATPAISTGSRAACAAATPMTRLAVEIRPSLAPSTAARSQPARPTRCAS
jgi:hypothetical protein